MKQKDMLNKVDEIDLHIANLNRTVKHLKEQKAELLKNCKHKFRNGEYATSLHHDNCAICGGELKNEANI